MAALKCTSFSASPLFPRFCGLLNDPQLDTRQHPFGIKVIVPGWVVVRLSNDRPGLYQIIVLSTLYCF